MPTPSLSDAQLRSAWRLYHEHGGNVTRAAESLGLNRSTFASRLRTAVEKLGPDVQNPPQIGGTVANLPTKHKPLPAAGQIKYYLTTCAQAHTHLHPGLWQNLQALARHYNAEILVSRFAYKKVSYGKKSIKPGKSPIREPMDAIGWFPDAIAPFVCDERTELAPGLIFCGEIQMLPTARRPLEGFESYTGRKSSIIPHPALAMVSVASAKGEPTKFLYTTGTITQRNYIQRREGLRAEQHHTYGALLTAVTSKGHWFCRQVLAGPDGELQDLDVLAMDGQVTTGNPVEAITWGDFHPAQADPDVLTSAFYPDGMLDTLQPKEQHFHDSFDCQARGHHNTRDPHKLYELHVHGKEDVRAELQLTSDLFRLSYRDWCQGIVVDSNHDRHLDRWLKEGDYRKDPLNAEIFLDLQREKYRAIRKGDRTFHLLHHALLHHTRALPPVRFLRQDESHVICQGLRGGASSTRPYEDGSIECGMHGDQGPNGTKPSPEGLAKMGRRANVAHSHSAGIYDGLFIAGTSSKLDLGYNTGPSSWSHSHVLTYPKGCRTVITLWKGQWRETV